MICESEWSMDVEEIIYDFQKLAVGKAEIKLMIVQFDDINVFNELIKICKKSISNKLLNDGSFYYLVGSGNDSNTVEFIPLSINHNTVPKRE